MHRYIFLDIDGVIALPKTPRMPLPPEGRWALTPEKVEILQWLVQKSGADLVISSGWRHETLEATIEKFRELEFPLADKIVGQTPKFYIRTNGEANRLPSCPRGVEIRSWLTGQHTFGEVYKVRYVILDDDNDMLIHQGPHLVRTRWNEGITVQQAKKALHILKTTVPNYL